MLFCICVKCLYAFVFDIKTQERLTRVRSKPRSVEPAYAQNPGASVNTCACPSGITFVSVIVFTNSLIC